MSNFRTTLKSNAVSLLFLLTMTFAVLALTQFQLVDDAYLYYRYAYNFAHHGELVFNLGERVEGFTSLLWTLLLAAVISVTKFQIEQGALLLSLFLVAFCMVRLWQLGPLLGGTHWVGVVAALQLILNPDFVGTCTQGLEGALFSALLVEVIYRYTRKQPYACVWFAGLLFLARPESAALGALCVILIYFQSRSSTLAIRAAAIWLAVLGLVSVFRFAYYGALIPNTVVAKSFGWALFPKAAANASIYLLYFAWSNPVLIGIIVWGIVVWLRKTAPFDLYKQILVFCLLGILFSFAVAIRNGGDWMPSHRLLAQYGVLYAVLVMVLCQRNKKSVVLVALLVMIPAMQTVISVSKAPNRTLFQYQNPSGFWVEATNRLASHIHPSDVISAEALGFISYTLKKNKFHDPAGLMDPYLAIHGRPSITFGKNDTTYTASVVRPAVMVWHWPGGKVDELEQHITDNYQTYCAADCGQPSANLVMIRNDRIHDLAPAFADWKKVKLVTGPTR